MKKFDTNVLDGHKADIKEISEIIYELHFSDDVWISLYDTSRKNKNYVQAHSDIYVIDNDVEELAMKALNINKEVFEEEEEHMFLVECRKYSGDKDFKHYRTFMIEPKDVAELFKRYINDEEIDTTGWYDVTDEFDEE